MLQTIRKLLDRRPAAYHPGEGFDGLIGKINRYFLKEPAKGKDLRDELYYLNNQIGHFSEEEKMIHSIIPYPFVLDFNYDDVEVFRDEEAGMFYVYLDGKKLYYHKGYDTIRDVQKSFTYLSVEQHPASPHRYLDGIFSVGAEDVVADLGAAEGNFSLMVADKVKALYIVEADAVWMDALHKTFEPWKDKVQIINKYVGGGAGPHNVSFDELAGEKEITALKMDVEGAEVEILKQVLSQERRKSLKMAVTTYHRHTDAEELQSLLRQHSFSTEFSRGHMLFVYDELAPPYFRKGLIRAYK